eukprot:8596989-Pyramimonas_sp.AAC.1
MTLKNTWLARQLHHAPHCHGGDQTACSSWSAQATPSVSSMTFSRIPVYLSTHHRLNNSLLKKTLQDYGISSSPQIARMMPLMFSMIVVDLV